MVNPRQQDRDQRLQTRIWRGNPVFLLSDYSFERGSFGEKTRGTRPAGRVALVDAFCLGLRPQRAGEVDVDLCSRRKPGWASR